MTIAVTGLRKSFRVRRGSAEVEALGGVNLNVAEGELMVVVGPSGSGKTTLLRCIAGLERPDDGTIEVAGRDVTELDAGARDVAMVFQEFALFPHISVRANIGFGLKARKEPEIDRRVTEASEALGLSALLDRRPGELSGGERQRVALARAIVRSPAAFLMDEPLSNLDAELRARTRADIRALQRRLGTTMVYVTHDQTEAMTMGDRVAVMRAGLLEQVGAPLELYDSPRTEFVARFLGSPAMNVAPSSVFGLSGDESAGVRPEALELTDPEGGRLSGGVVAVEPIGVETLVHVEVGGHVLIVRAHGRPSIRVGDRAGLAFADGSVARFDPSGAAR